MFELFAKFSGFSIFFILKVSKLVSKSSNLNLVDWLNKSVFKAVLKLSQLLRCLLFSLPINKSAGANRGFRIANGLIKFNKFNKLELFCNKTLLAIPEKLFDPSGEDFIPN
ncbi:MAG: hypothetical protein KME50_27210 [Nostoc desertorum CM1-VF14]|nr:hypothetical protein [Nostoc desertorum CM1-VF14]